MTASSATLHVEYRATSQASELMRTSGLVAELADAVELDFPSGFDLSVVDARGPIFRAWGGSACRVEDEVAIERTTRYDLASLTKVVATTTIALWLLQNRRWSLGDRVVAWLPRFPRSDLTLYHLLTHTSGLVAHVPFFHLGRDSRAIRRALYAQAAADGPPGSVLYSDLNFILLGWAIARCTGEPLDRLFGDVVAGPLTMPTTRYRPRVAQRRLTAATELDGDQRLTPGLIWGEVHDGNAWALGGVAGHAGLFAPAEDMSRFVAALLDSANHPVLSESTIDSITQTREGDGSEQRGIGWRLNPRDWGDWPADTYWHTGFTGTSLLVAPSAGVGVVLMTNAIHPHRQLERQAELRRRLHLVVSGWRS